MPPRKRRRKQEPEHPDPLVRFGRAVKAANERDKVAQQRREAERAEANRRRREARVLAEKIAAAKVDLERAIAGAKAARSSGAGIPEADAAWRVAKARLIELETGETPEWAPASSDADPTTGQSASPSDAPTE